MYVDPVADRRDVDVEVCIDRDPISPKVAESRMRSLNVLDRLDVVAAGTGSVNADPVGWVFSHVTHVWETKFTKVDVASCIDGDTADASIRSKLKTLDRTDVALRVSRKNERVAVYQWSSIRPSVHAGRRQAYLGVRRNLVRR